MFLQALLLVGFLTACGASSLIAGGFQLSVRDANGPAPFELAYDRGAGGIDKVGFIYPPSLLAALHEWNRLHVEPSPGDRRGAGAMNASVVYVVFSAFRQPSSRQLAEAVSRGPLRAVTTTSLTRGKPVVAVETHEGREALSVSTDRAAILALDPRLEGKDVFALATFELDVIKPGIDVVLYQSGVNAAGQITYYFRRGTVPTSITSGR